MSLRLALLLLTASAALPAWAADEARQAPGAEGCQVAEEDPTNPNTAVERSGSGARAVQERGVPSSGHPDGGTRTPRWHSFLPGMFR